MIKALKEGLITVITIIGITMVVYGTVKVLDVIVSAITLKIFLGI